MAGRRSRRRAKRRQAARITGAGLAAGGATAAAAAAGFSSAPTIWQLLSMCAAVLITGGLAIRAELRAPPDPRGGDVAGKSRIPLEVLPCQKTVQIA
jgi:hypothetical protein